MMRPSDINNTRKYPSAQRSEAFTPYKKGKLKPYIKNAFLLELTFQNRRLDFLTENGTLYTVIYEYESFELIGRKKNQAFKALCSFQYHTNGARVVIVRATETVPRLS